MGQEQGRFPVGWSEWNDRFRDTFRAAQNKLGIVSVTPGMMATRFAGSDDLFRPRGRKPWNSVNYIVVHDGFTLRDLYSYNAPQNSQAYPYGPSPGGRSAAEEMCWDQGGDPVQQRQAARTGAALLLLSAGVPHIAGAPRSTGRSSATTMRSTSTHQSTGSTGGALPPRPLCCALSGYCSSFGAAIRRYAQRIFSRASRGASAVSRTSLGIKTTAAK
jgi:hypothetical protein